MSTSSRLTLIEVERRSVRAPSTVRHLRLARRRIAERRAVAPPRHAHLRRSYD